MASSKLSKPAGLFEDVKIIKQIFLLLDRQGIAEKYSVLNKKISSVLQSAPFKAEWIIRNAQNHLDLWLRAYLKKINLDAIHYQDWISNQIYRTPSSPLFIDNLVTKDELVLSRLIHHYSITAIDSSVSKDRVKGLWVHLLLSRSLMALSLVLEDNAVFFQVLLTSPWLMKFCIYACVLTPTFQDGEKGLAVLKFILDHSRAHGMSPEIAVLQEALAMACHLGLFGHVQVLAPLCDQEKKACLWMEMACKPTTVSATLPNTAQVLEVLFLDLAPGLQKFISKAKTLVVGQEGEERDSSALKYLKFEQMVLENSTKGYNESLRQLWCLLNEDCLLNRDFQGVLAFAGFYNQDEHLILPLSQLGLAVQEASKSGNSPTAVAAVEALLPLIDCAAPGNFIPTPAQRLSTLFTEYCKTPKKQLFSQLFTGPLFSMQQLSRFKKSVLEHQLSVISYLYGALKKDDDNYKIQSTDIWESIQAGNSELSSLLQTWGGAPAWMEASDTNVSKKENSVAAKSFLSSTTGASSMTGTSLLGTAPIKKSSMNAEDSDVESSGMFMAFDGEKSSFAITKLMTNSTGDSSFNGNFTSDFSKSNRVNIFATDSNSNGEGTSSSMLGARRARRMNHQAKLLMQETLPSLSRRNSNAQQTASAPKARANSFTSAQSQQSNQIWDVYFKSDLKKLQKLLSETSLTNFDWMEVQDKRIKMKAGGINGNELNDKTEMGSIEDQAILQKYTQLY